MSASFLIRRSLFSLPMIFAAGLLSAQGSGSNEQDLIQASQGAASAMFFSPDTKADASPGSYYNEGETLVRGGLPDLLSSLKKGAPVTIAYIGGSITQGEYGYRQQSAGFISHRYPGAQIQFINAGVSGTGTDLGACRLGQMVLVHHPDLVFIEFAVNGAYQPGMEGMVRQIRKKNPGTGICFIYTISSGQTAAYSAGRIPDNIKGLEKIAEHYGIMSVHLGMEPADLEKEGKLLWKGTPAEAKGKILFSSDGIHPLPEGGNLYAAAIARAFLKLEKTRPEAAKALPEPLLADNWEQGGMYDPLSIATFKGSWKKQIPAKKEYFSRYLAWFPYIMSSGVPGDSFTFSFTGDVFGLFDIGGPEVGQFEVEVDGELIRLSEVSTRGYRLYTADPEGRIERINLFNSYCNNRYRGQYDFIRVPAGRHTVTVRIAAVKADKQKILGKNTEDINAHPEKYDQTVLHLGRILIKGIPVPSGE